jgi:hypothetical protein
VVEGYFELAGAVRSRLGRIEEVAVGDLHGDVNTNNVLVTAAGAVALVDPNRRRGIVLDDVAHLAAELRAGRVRALSQGRVPGRRVTERRIGALTSGYGSPDPQVLEPLVARDLLVRWRAAEIRLQRRGVAPVRISMRRHVRREIESALAGG